MNAPASADYLIVGSGIAGLRAAVSLAAHGSVVILTKTRRDAGSTGYAQGGIAAAVGPDDSVDLHTADTVAAGDGLCDAAAVRVLVEDGRRYVQEMIEWGAVFDRRADGTLDLAREGAHSRSRVLHARDATGREIARTLGARLAEASRGREVEVRDHATVVQLVVRSGRVAGARYLDETGTLREVIAGATLVATGGAGHVFSETTNPPVATGDGVALAWLAGARVSDLEFVQFHPTALVVPGFPRYLLTEALRGEGARLVTSNGEPFMAKYDPAGDLAPRDRVARAIVLESRRTGAPVHLSLAHLPPEQVRARFPHVAALCARAGLDLATDLLPVGPAAHYMMGGVATDLDGRTTLPGLFAAGEAACTGVHGANRLASNSLLEGLVFGARAAAAMRNAGQSWPDATPARQDDPAAVAAMPAAAADLPDAAGPAAPVTDDEDGETASLRALMWRRAGVFRDRAGLLEASQELDRRWRDVERAFRDRRPLDRVRWRRISLIVVARLITRAALAREESRGAHSRTDFPRRDDLHWRRHLHDTRDR